MNLILDFDSTIVQAEGLDVLAEICLKGDKDRIENIKKLTDEGMSGAISMEESLTERIRLMHINKKDLPLAIQELKTKLSPTINSILNSIPFNQIYVVSGGFEEYVIPVCQSLGIIPENITCNRFIYNGDFVIGYDTSAVVSKSKGKVQAINEFQLQSPIYLVGDGYTDYEAKLYGAVDVFIAFTETAERPQVVAKADFVCKNFNEVNIIINDQRI